MLFTASTVKDSPENTRFFVAANLASGVDHMVVFLDDPRDPVQQDVAAELAAHPHVTCLPTDRGWWQGDRPNRLNVRQRINANLVVALLADVPDAQWVVHVDGDEVVHADADALASVPPDTGALWLSPLEAVSTLEAPQRPTLFKRLLEAEDLQLLTVLGVLDAPTNQSYFHGHVLGKSGVRPRAGLHLTLHDSVHPDGRRLRSPERFEHPGLSVLHYDAVSGQEFIRKWTAMVAAGPTSLRPDRAPVAMALRSLVGKDLDPAVAETYLRAVYERTTQDAVETLADLQLLEQVDPTQGTHRPAEMGGATRSAFEQGLDRLREEPKRPFHINHSEPEAAEEAGTLDRLRRRIGRGQA